MEKPISEPQELQPRPFSAALQEVLAAYGRETSMSGEVGALRAVLTQLMTTSGDDLPALVDGVPRLANAIGRALRTQRLLAGEVATDLNEMMTRILTELGIGE